MLAEDKNPHSGSQVRPEYLVRGSMRLIVLPDVFMRLNHLVDDPNASVSEIARLIGEDPALTARLLKLANSPFYGYSTRINSLARAVTVIGGRGLRDLVLASAVCDLFQRLGDNHFDRDAFWRHSLDCGLGARLIGMHSGISEAESLFATGLLHDIGQLVLLDKLPEMARETQLRACDSGIPLHELERSVIGCDHADVGGELLRQWRLPETLCEPVACHHAPGNAVHAPLSAAIVHFADIMAHELPRTAMTDPDAILAAIEARVSEPVFDLMRIDQHLLQEIHEEILLQCAIVSDVMQAA